MKRYLIMPIERSEILHEFFDNADKKIQLSEMKPL